MRKFQIRFADTGYPHIIDQVSSIEALKEKIFKECKIDKNNQRLLSKKGNIITGNDRLDNQSIMKKTFSGDVNNPTAVNEVMGMYLFNHKELLKNTSEERNIEQQSKNVLIKKHQNFMTLRTKIFELEPFSKRFGQEQIQKIATFNPNLIPVAQQWHSSVSEVINLRQNFKQTEACFDEYIERWENQRKALIVLTKNIEILVSEKRGPIQKLSQNLQSLKKRFEQECAPEAELLSSLNQSTSSAMYIQQVGLVRSAIDSLKKKTSNLNLLYHNIFKKSTTYRRNIKQTHIDLQKEIKKIDEFKKKKSLEMEQIETQMKENYLTLIEAMREKLDAKSESKLAYFLSERKNIDARLQKLRREAKQYVSQMQKKFVQMYSYYIDHESMVHTQYRTYNQIQIQIEQALKQNIQVIQNQIYNIHKHTLDLSKVRKQVKQEYKQRVEQKTIKELEDNEYKRRHVFNNKLICLQEQIKQIFKEEEKERTQYLENVLRLYEMYDNQILCNVRVPCFILNFDQCSDRDVLALGKSLAKGGSLGVGKENGFEDIDLGMYKASTGMDRILRQLQVIKECQSAIKSENPSMKQKNLEILLQKSSQIFHKIYSHKLNLLTKQYKEASQGQLKKIESIQRQNKQLKQKVMIGSHVDTDYRKQLQDSVCNLKNELDQVINRSVEMERKFVEGSKLQEWKIKENEVKLKQDEEKIKHYESLIEENKRQISKLRSQKKQMQERISKQVSSTMETLLLELEKSATTIKQLEELNHEYKIVMGDQAIKIATMEAQLFIQNQSQLAGKAEFDQMKLLQNSFYGNHGNEVSYPVEPVIRECLQVGEEIMHEKVGQNGIKSQQNIESTPVLSKNSRSLKNEELKQLQKEISKLEKQIQQLKEQNEGLTTQNENLNEQIMKIAMKETQDQETQTEQQLPKSNTQLLVPHLSTTVLTTNSLNIKIEKAPQPGQTRIFIPFSPGVYICLASRNSQSAHSSHSNYLTSQTRNYINIHQMELAAEQQTQQNYPHILDMNCLSGKARQLLTECTLIVVLRVSKILPGAEKYYVEGEILSAVGFQDEDMAVRDYAGFFK